MGKPKNKGKSRNEDEDSDTELADQQEEEMEQPTAKLSKKEKRRKKKDDDDWEADVASELAGMSIDANKDRKEEEEEEAPAPVVNKKEKKKKKKQKAEDDDDDEDDTSTQSSKKVSAFNMLMMDDDDDDAKSESDNEKEEAKEEVQETSKQQKKKDKKKKDKKEKGKTAEEEDLDAILAAIDKPAEKTGKKGKKGKKNEAQEKEETDTNDKEAEAVVAEVEKVEPKVVTMEDLEDEDDTKKKRKKKGKEKEVKEQEEDGEKMEEGAEGEEGEGPTVKTAAQKRKEKKEREKKKLAEKKKLSAKKDTKTEGDKDTEEGKTEDTAEADTAEKKGSGDEGEAEEDGKKKKKDKKKKGEKEEKVKKPNARIKAMQEILKKQKEDEERHQKEEEERIRKEEEAITAAIEQKQQEEIKKAEKKERQRLKREQLKAEGKLLTPAQKAERKRALEMLEMMKAQGITIPDKEEAKKKRPVYERKKKKPQKKEDTPGSEETPSPTDTPASTPQQEEAPEIEAKQETEEVDKVAEAEAVIEDVKDEWDASSEEEQEEEEKESSPEAETKIEVVDKKVDEQEEEEEDSDDEEDDEDDEESEESEEESESEDDEDLTPYERAEARIKKHHDKCEANRTTDTLRAPVVCVLGHVDTGKTKILDKLRRTNVQDGEAGGITQQIGATNVPAHAILEKTTMCKDFQKKEFKLPGLLIIDTPGHESFSNLRNRGSSLCDIAILVIDIMHGLEPQTIESINLLKDRKTPFVVALNKIDRLYQWKTNPNSDVMNTIKKQSQICKQEFDERKQAVITQLAEQSLNAALFYENKNPKEYVSLVPTSAHTGDGMGNLLSLICELCQTWLAKKISYSHELNATVMEVKALPGLGTTIDVILVNGKLNESDHIVLAGTEGPIVTQIRGLLMPQPMRELRVKGQYEHQKEVVAAQGVKIIGKDLEKALAGLPLYIARDDDEIEYYKEELSLALKDVLNSIKLTERGVFVQASTLGSLEALLEFLRTSKIPYAGINIGPVHRRDIMRASIMLEHDPQWAVILAFDVKVERDAQEMADSLGVNIFTADIIYHLQDKFLKYREDLKKAKKEEFQHVAVFPCKLRVLPQHIFNKRDPIVMGVTVEAGILRLGTPICVPSKEFVHLGQITSIEVNHKTMETARKGQEVCIKIENIPGETPKLFGRHFDHEDMLISKISRNSIDAVKDYFRDEMTKQDWTLMVELKRLFQIL